MPEIACKRLFDGERLRDDVVIRVADGRITAVEPSGGATPSADRIAAAFVMPGLIDAHAHVSGYREGMPMGAPFEPPKHFLRLCALHGVTTIRDTGNSLETVLYLRLWGERHAAPRVFSSGPILDAPPLTWPFSRVVRDAAEAEREVARLAAEDVDFVKAYARIAPPVLEAIVAAATAHGLPVAVDCHATTARAAAALGVRSIEHVANLLEDAMLVAGDASPPNGSVGEALRWSRIDLDGAALDELIRLLRERRTYVTPTLLVGRRWALVEEMVGAPELEWMVAVMPFHRHLLRMRSAIGMRVGRRYMQRYMPMPTLDRRQRDAVERGLARQGEVTRRLMAAGVNVVAGTDSPNPSLVPGASLHHELAEMVRWGVPPLDALAAATARPAALLGRDDLGTVRAGAQADLLLLDGDPTLDIRALGAIERVMCRGHWVDREAARAKLREAIERDGPDER